MALDYDTDTSKGERAVKVETTTTNVFSLFPRKVILLGDSAVGKSKLVERFLLDGYAPQQLSTYALTLYRCNVKKMCRKYFQTIPRYRTKVGTRDVLIDFWDTAGQERFNTMHRSYYHQAHACIMVFDATRKV